MPTEATKPRSPRTTNQGSPLRHRSTKSLTDRPCPLSRDSLLYLRRRSNALICSFTSGYPEDYSGSSVAAPSSSTDLHSSRSGVHSKKESVCYSSTNGVAVHSTSSFGAAPSSSSNGVEIFYDAATEVVFSSSGVDSPFSRRFPSSTSGKRRQDPRSHSSFSSNAASPRHVCAAFTGVGLGAAPSAHFGADFCCVVCGKKAPKAESRRKCGDGSGSGAAETSTARRRSKRDLRRQDAVEVNGSDCANKEIATGNFLRKFKGLRKLRSNW